MCENRNCKFDKKISDINEKNNLKMDVNKFIRDLEINIKNCSYYYRNYIININDLGLKIYQ